MEGGAAAYVVFELEGGNTNLGRGREVGEVGGGGDCGMVREIRGVGGMDGERGELLIAHH